MNAQMLRLTRIVLYLGLTLPLMPVQAVAMTFGMPLAKRLPRLYHGWVCRVLGFKLSVEGKPTDASPALYISNHTSYLDIEILGATIEGSFVSKAEVARWPLFGWLAKLQRSVFIDRQKSAAAGHRNAIIKRLDQGDRLILFPEGTSSDGNHVMPFKSSLFGAAEYRHDGVPITVQPVSVAYVRLDGIPIGRSFRPYFAWYGEMELAPHLWTALGMGILNVEITFHAPVTIDQFATRKELAQYCQRIVSDGVAESLAGRRQASPAGARRARAKRRMQEPVRVS
jgi:lyso-ornithine lipid O-acyltransferase